MASPFDYAIIRVVPRVEREEFVNAGVIVFARTLDYLGCACALEDARVIALDPTADLAAIRRHLAGIEGICTGDAKAGAIAQLPRPDRFHWLTTPRSTLIQPSPVHSGMTDDPASIQRELIARYVARP